MERHQREWKKCFHPDSNRDPPAYTADCSAIELLRIYIYICNWCHFRCLTEEEQFGSKRFINNNPARVFSLEQEGALPRVVAARIQ